MMEHVDIDSVNPPVHSVHSDSASLINITILGKEFSIEEEPFHAAELHKDGKNKKKKTKAQREKDKKEEEIKDQHHHQKPPPIERDTRFQITIDMNEVQQAAHLRNAIQETNPKCIIKECVFIGLSEDEQTGTLYEIPYMDDEYIDWKARNIKTIKIEKGIHMHVIHKGVESQMVCPKDTHIAKVKQAYQREEGQTLETLTYDGKKVYDNDTLAALNVKNHGELFGKLQVSIEDSDANMQAMLEVTHDQMLEDVLKMFELARRRTLPPGSKLFASDAPAVSLELQRTVFENGIKDDTALLLQTPDYEITLREPQEGRRTAQGQQDISQSLRVFDWWTIKRVKAEFNRINNLMEGLGNGDKLIYANEELEDDIQLYKYRIVPGRSTELNIKREEIAENVFPYICSDCGADVPLKRSDQVRCRTCFGRILYKKRTLRPCQYLCR